MAIQYVGGYVDTTVGSTTADFTVSFGGNLTGGLANTPANGDLVIVSYTIGFDDVTPTDRNIITSGYTQFANLSATDLNAVKLQASYKFMGSTPDTSVVITRTNSTIIGTACIVSVWRNVNSSVFDVTTTTATGINGGKVTPPAITPTTTGSIIICCGATATDGTVTFTASQLSNFLYTAEQESNADAQIGLGSYAWTSGTFTPTQWGGGTTSTNDSWASYTAVLKPAVTTLIKTINGLSKDSVKTIGGLPIASVKTVGGLS